MNPEPGEDMAPPAMLLDGFEPVEPDPAVWQRIVGEINGDVPRLGDVDSRQRRVPRWAPYLVSVAAVFVLLLGAMALITSQAGDIVASRDLVAPGSEAVVLSIDTDGEGSSVVSASGLPVLAEGETYQLWAVTGSEIVSVGLLGSDADGAEFRIEGDPSVLALTVEVAGGVAVSEQDPVAVWQA